MILPVPSNVGVERMSLITLTVMVEIIWLVAIYAIMTGDHKSRLDMIQITLTVACLGGTVLGSIHLTAWLAADVKGDALYWYALALINLPLGLRVRDVRIQNYGIPAS